MTTPLVSTLVQGAAELYVSTSSTPTFPVDAADVADLRAGDFSGWVGVGRTTDAVKLMDKPTMVEAKSQQSARVEAMAVSEWETTIETTCREVVLSTIANLVHGSATSTELTPGVAGAAPVIALAIVGPWQPGSTSLTVVEFGVIDSGLELSFDKNEFSSVPLKVRVLQGSELPSGYKVTILS